MEKNLILLTFVVIFCSGKNAQAEPFSIYEIQYTTDVNGNSNLNGHIVDCLGGIVTHKPPTGRPRLIIQDPNYSEGWSAVQVKDLFSTGVFDDVNVGDWISLTNVLVEESKGTTFLQYIEDNNPFLTIVSTNNLLPRPLVVSIDEITAPPEGIDVWIVPDHYAEKYESMLIKVIDVYVQDTGYGKAFDNYLLTSNVDPNFTCWVSDYMNIGKDRGLIYHPLVEIDQNFCGVAGILEQYTEDSEGIYYDYYQLLTTSTGSFTIEQIADLDGDCDVDFADFGIFGEHWLEGT